LADTAPDSATEKVDHVAECGDWTVVFFERTHKFMWEPKRSLHSYFTSSGFHHVFCIKKIGDVFACVDWTFGKLVIDLQISSRTYNDLVILMELYDGTVLSVPDREPHAGKVIRFPLLSCVQVTQQCLGVYKPFIITPKSLCRYLISMDDTKILRKGKGFGNIR
jgi:hypothetical protein